MNRVKLTISDENGTSLCKLGTSILRPKNGNEYSDEEIRNLLYDWASLFDVKIYSTRQSNDDDAKIKTYYL